MHVVAKGKNTLLSVVCVSLGCGVCFLTGKFNVDRGTMVAFFLRAGDTNLIFFALTGHSMMLAINLLVIYHGESVVVPGDSLVLLGGGGTEDMLVWTAREGAVDGGGRSS